MRKNFAFVAFWPLFEREFDLPNFNKVRYELVSRAAQKAIAEAKKNPRFAKDALAVKGVEFWWRDVRLHEGCTPARMLTIRFHTVCKRPGAFLNGFEFFLKKELKKFDPTFSIRGIERRVEKYGSL